MADVATDTGEPEQGFDQGVEASSSRKKKSQRIHVIFPDALHEKLARLQKLTFASSNTEVIRDALLLYSALVEERNRGKEVIVRDPNDGKEIIYPVFM